MHAVVEDKIHQCEQELMKTGGPIYSASDRHNLRSSFSNALVTYHALGYPSSSQKLMVRLFQAIKAKAEIGVADLETLVWETAVFLETGLPSPSSCSQDSQALLEAHVVIRDFGTKRQDILDRCVVDVEAEMKAALPADAIVPARVSANFPGYAALQVHMDLAHTLSTLHQTLCQAIQVLGPSGDGQQYSMSRMTEQMSYFSRIKELSTTLSDTTKEAIQKIEKSFQAASSQQGAALYKVKMAAFKDAASKAVKMVDDPTADDMALRESLQTLSVTAHIAKQVATWSETPEHDRNVVSFAESTVLPFCTGARDAMKANDSQDGSQDLICLTLAPELTEAVSQLMAFEDLRH